MKLVGDLLFNLQFNAIASFWLGLVAAFALVRSFRLRESSLALVLFVLPFAKVLADLTRGVPADSFFWASRLGRAQRLGSFRIGFGFHPPLAVPVFDGVIWAIHEDGQSPQSLADLLGRALSRRVWVHAAPVLAWTIMTISLLLVVVRAVRILRASAGAARLRVRAGHVEPRFLGRRRVQIVFSDAYRGVPFAGGLLRPFVILSRRTSDALTAEEREAVIQHELAHVAHLDLLWLIGTAMIGDFLWYVPGARLLVRRIGALIEIRADRAAVASGVRASALASAIVSTGQLALHGKLEPALLARGRQSVLRRRLERLLDSGKSTTRTGRAARLGRLMLIAYLAIGVLQSVCCGNHSG